jgi:hypothetical protein
MTTAPLVAGDVLYYLSVPSASAGYATAGTAGNCWGGWFSTTVLSGTPLDNIFTDLTGPENAASQVDYACLFVLNNTSNGNTMLNAYAWLPTASYVAGGATIALGVDTTATSLKNASSQQALKIVNATTAPAGISTWVTPQSSAPTYPSFSGGVPLGSIPPGYVKAVWYKRSAANTAALNNDGFGIQVLFDTMG